MAWLGLRARPAGGRHAQGTRLEPIIARCEKPIQAGMFARKTTGSEPVLTGLLSTLAGHRDLLSRRADVRPERETRREKLAATPRRAAPRPEVAPSDERPHSMGQRRNTRIIHYSATVKGRAAAFDFSVVVGPFFTPQKNQKNRENHRKLCRNCSGNNVLDTWEMRKTRSRPVGVTYFFAGGGAKPRRRVFSVTLTGIRNCKR